MGWRAMAVAGVCHGQLIVKQEQRNNAGKPRLWHRASTTSLVVGGDRALLRGGNLQPCRLAYARMHPARCPGCTAACACRVPCMICIPCPKERHVYA
jgi:hypothetical protein